MSVNLGKGQKVSLAKVAADAGITTPLQKLRLGLGWSPQKASGGTYDLDVSVFLVDANNKTKDENFIYYGNKSTANKSVVHSGDNLTGDGDGDDETIEIDLTKIPADIDKIVAVVTIYEAKKKGQTFGQVDDTYARLYDVTNGKPVELLKYELNEDMSRDTAVHVCDIYRKDGEWKFNAAGQGQVEGLDAICRLFGMDVNS